MDKDEALRKALEALESQQPDNPFSLESKAIASVKQALAAQPAPLQDLPFGVGGGLVAIKTLLGRDPCVHANTAIEMIDAILSAPAAQPAVPDAITDKSESPEYRAGWNDCRELTIQMRKP